METNNTTPFKEVARRFNTDFKMLQQKGDKKKYLTAKITVSGYTDLIKASLLALEAEEPFPSKEIRNPNSNVCGLLDLALQPMPYEETELLDILRSIHLTTDKEKQE